MAVNIKNLKIIGRVNFLSRLRGGEQHVLFLNLEPIFLSRLRGGEHLAKLIYIFYFFLSRLRGGELR